MNQGTALPSADEVRALIAYDPDRGTFHWKEARSKVKAGDPAGNVRPSDGRLVIRLNGKNHYAYRLAWLVVTGDWPTDEIDHRNGDHTDNRWMNLRAVTHSENNQNKNRLPSNNTSGYRGIVWHNRDRLWGAVIREGGRIHHLGWFKEPSDASAAYEGARARLHTAWIPQGLPQ